MYFWKKGIYHNPKFKDHFVVCDVALHNGCFWKILSKKYSKTISKIEVCLKYFFDKKIPQNIHCANARARTKISFWTVLSLT